MFNSQLVISSRHTIRNYAVHAQDYIYIPSVTGLPFTDLNTSYSTAAADYYYISRYTSKLKKNINFVSFFIFFSVPVEFQRTFQDAATLRMS